jgi:hypothetical protein
MSNVFVCEKHRLIPKRSFAVVLLFAVIPLFGQIASLSVGPTPITTVPPDFMGFSCEWNVCAPNAGNGVLGQRSQGVDTIYRQMLTNLRILGATPPLRIGGNSADVQNVPYATEPLTELNAYDGTLFTISLPMKTATAAQAATIAHHYYAAMPSAIQAFELGNEPDTYGWSSATYYANLNVWVSSIQGATRNSVRFEGPSFSYFSNANIKTFNVAASNSLISIITMHYYAGSNTSCGSQTDCLLRPSAYRVIPSLYRIATSSHNLGKKIRINEMGPQWNGGEAGISNSFSSALWFIYNAFRGVSYGLDGINIAGSNQQLGSKYDPFGITVTIGHPNTYSLKVVNPAYYAMYFFDVATQNNAHLYPVTVTLTGSNTCRFSGWTTLAGTVIPAGCLQAWETVDMSGTQRLVIVNLDESLAGNLSIRNAAKTASVCYLSNSAIPAYSGLGPTTTFAAQTWAGSTDGTIQGTASYVTLAPSNGMFSIPISATQAAIVRFGANSGC